MARIYFPNPYSYFSIAYIPTQEAAAQRPFEAEGLELRYVAENWYLGKYKSPREYIDDWY